MASSSERFPQIDALRAIAVLLVVWFHAVYFISPEVIKGPWVSAMLLPVDPGRVGVVLFFAISGFVIPASLSGPRAEGTYTFLVRRFFRLYPAYWLSIAIGLLPLWLDAQFVSLSTIAANISMIENVLGYPLIVGVYWTLETELVFYGICVVFFLLRIIDRPATFVWMILVMGAGQWGWNKAIELALQAQNLPSDTLSTKLRIVQYLVGDPVAAAIGLNGMFLAHLSIMGLGALFRFWYDGKLQHRFGRLFLFLVSAFWILVVWREGIWYWYRGIWTWHFARFQLSYTMGVALFVFLVGVPRFRWQPLVYIGTISYSLYLFHLPLIMCTKTLLDRAGLSGVAATPAISVPAVIALSIGFSAIVYSMVERPAINLGRRLTKRSVQIGGVAESSPGV